MAANMLLLLFAATLTQAVLGLRIEESQPSQADLRVDWPCPEAGDIHPCICIRSNQHLNLDCSAVQDDDELKAVFKANFPFQNFTQLTILAKPQDKRIPINYLTEDIFQNVTFAEIRISHTDLSFIYPTVFDNSAFRLEILIVTDSFVSIFPFDVVDKAPVLTDLRVFRNEILHMPEMTSDSLTYLQISYNPGLSYGDHAFEALPNLEYLVANDIGLSHIAAKEFSKNTKLIYLDMSYNNIETLYQDSLMFQSPIQEIRLNSNNIHTVEVGAISGLGTAKQVFLWMHNNSVVSLDQNVWEPVFNSVRNIPVRNFVFDGNPFHCGCNILWLAIDPQLLSTIARGTKCTDNAEDILDVDVPFLVANCS